MSPFSAISEEKWRTATLLYVTTVLARVKQERVSLSSLLFHTTCCLDTERWEKEVHPHCSDSLL